LPVPEGFVVTTDAYASVISSLDLKIVERAGGGEAALMRSDVEAAIIPAEVRAAIVKAYADLGAGIARCLNC
jgi:phosphoenolpyruvate synthase/pyruvate phosphate dikinase